MTTTILIVVEHDMLRETLKMWLAQTFPNYQIRAADNETEAIALMPSNPPQLIILDAGLPEAKNFEAIKRIRHLLPITPILVLTSYESEPHRSHALASGATIFFRKDAMLTELQPTIAALLVLPAAPNGYTQKRVLEQSE